MHGCTFENDAGQYSHAAVEGVVFDSQRFMFGWEYHAPVLHIEASRQHIEGWFRSRPPGVMWIQFQTPMCFRM
jgi:hypothetical protein